MNQGVTTHLQNKLLAKRMRLKSTEINPNYQNFEIEPESSKAFGFPDNTLIQDPDASILGNPITDVNNNMLGLGGAQKKDESTNKDAGKVSSNLACDRLQAMFALGTSSGMIKIFSLKGYELDVYDAHDEEIRHVAFVPNQGKLVTIDVTNMLKLWDLEELSDCEVALQIPHPGNSRVSCLYVPSFITSIADNHNHFFIGMDQGDIYVFDL